MTLTLATWNINSVRLRLPIVEKLLDEKNPDILCLQETKCANELFPAEAFTARGYQHQAINGQKGYHGVAILSKLPLSEIDCRDHGNVGHARHVSAVFETGGKRIRLHNFYVPAGGDEPDVVKNPKFAHKLDYIEEMKALKADAEAGVSSILVGDLNIAPLEHDVWSHKQMLKIVSHTPVETQGLLDVIAKGGWVDLMRQHTPEPAKLYTWWSYRAADWAASDRGRRLDHVWSSPDLAPHLSGVEILRDARGWDKPSDHVPVIANLTF
ncbi:exodeoxyribonuclease III [Rhizobium sp. FKL33]|uniref:exodeoxyribonuclease III n=1 Tax=Rhizobium sp. FKL33 TaxID=2562307 RepID=UPI0010C06A42|nr:exodeoxyribonuclease III [Rhizobium sp. FKL33]